MNHHLLRLLAAVLLTSPLVAGEADGRWRALGEPGSGGWITGIAPHPRDAQRLILCGDMLGIGVSGDAGRSWTWGQGLPSYEIGDATWHPVETDTVWAGTMSGPCVSRDGGRTWRVMRSGMPAVDGGRYTAPIEKVLCDPSDHRRLLAFGGSSRGWSSPGKPLWGVVWQSRDAGATWQRLATLTAQGAQIPGTTPGANLVGATFAPAAPQRLYVAASGTGIFVSEDAGATWALRNTGLPATSVERIVAHPTRADTAWVCLNRFKDGAQWRPGGIFRTTDAGRTWSSSSAGLPQVAHRDENFSSGYKALAVSPTDPQVLWTADLAWNTGIIHRSGDGGASWRAVAAHAAREGLARIRTAYFAGAGLTVMTAHPTDATRVYGAGAEYLVAGSADGAAWEDLTATEVTPGAWRGRGFSGLCSIGFRFDPWRRGRAILTAMDAGKCWETVDAGASWTFHGTDPWPWGGGVDACFARDGSAYVTTGQFGNHGSVLRGTPDGTWSTLCGPSHGLPAFDGRKPGGGVHCRSDDSRQVWACLGGDLHHSTDGGAQWTKMGVRGDWLAGDAQRPARLFVANSHEVLVSDDGRRFTAIGGPQVAGRMAVDAQGRLLLVAYRGKRPGLWRWDGTAWMRLFDDGLLSNVAVDPTDAQRLAVCFNDDPYHDVCNARGVWLSVDGGATWGAFNQDLPIVRGWALAFDPFVPGRLVSGSQGSGYFTATVPAGWAPEQAYRHASSSEDAAFAAVRAPVRRIANGDMTGGGDVPDRWDQQWTGKGRIAVKRDTAVFHTAPASLCVASVGGPAQGNASCVVACAGGQTLELTGWVKTEGTVKVNIFAQPFSADWKPLGFIQVGYRHDNAAHDWSEWTGKAELPPATARCLVGLLIEGEGRAWLDDVRLTGDAPFADQAAPPAAQPLVIGDLTLAPPPPGDPASTPLPKGKPWVPGWCRWDWRAAWVATHAGFVANTRRLAGKVDVVFYGDSITQGFGEGVKAFAPELTIVNYGIGGDSTRQLLYRISHGEVDGIAPKLVVVAIGTNNLYDDANGGSDEDIATGIATVVQLLRAKLPTSRILVLGILPRQNDWFCGRAKAINQRTARLDDGRMVTVFSMWDAFFDAASTDANCRVRKDLFDKDLLHLGPAGYDTWRKAMQPVFDRLLR